MIGKYVEAKAKGDACNRCRIRRVRCTGVDGKPCAACLRTAKFRNHKLDQVFCGYHGAGPCSEEQDDHDKPRKKRVRTARSQSTTSSTSSTKSSSDDSDYRPSSARSSRSLGKKAVVPDLKPSPRMPPSPPLIPLMTDEPVASTSTSPISLQLPSAAILESFSSVTSLLGGKTAPSVGTNSAFVGNTASSSTAALPIQMPVQPPVPNNDYFNLLSSYNIAASTSVDPMSSMWISLPQTSQSKLGPLDAQTSTFSSLASSSYASSYSSSSTPPSYAHSSCSSPSSEDLLSTPEMSSLAAPEAPIFTLPAGQAPSLGDDLFASLTNGLSMPLDQTTPFWYGSGSDESSAVSEQYFAPSWPGFSPQKTAASLPSTGSMPSFPWAQTPSLFL